MSYVYQQPKSSPQQSPQQQQQKKREQQKKQSKRSQQYRVQEVQRSPLSRFTAWALNKASGTVLERLVKFLLGESLVGRLTSVVIVSLVLGSVIDLVIISVPVLASSTTAIGAVVTTTAVLGALAGGGAGGVGGAIIGAIWGWLVGEISDSIVAELVSEQAARIAGPILTWIIATISGLLAGYLAAWGFEKLSGKNPGLGRFIARIFILIALIAIGYGAFRIIMLFVVR